LRKAHEVAEAGNPASTLKQAAAPGSFVLSLDRPREPIRNYVERQNLKLLTTNCRLYHLEMPADVFILCKAETWAG
jgi:hypothetical protein